MEATTYRKNQEYVGKTVSVLFDEYKDGWVTGNSREMKRVRMKGESGLVGKIQECTVFRADTWMMWGRLNDKCLMIND